MPGEGGWRFAVDRGGTFTDIVAHSPTGGVQVRKVPSDLGDDADPALAAIREVLGIGADEPIPAARVESIRYGTTVATNALLTRQGERCALFVTKGFADLLRIGTGERPDLFALAIEKAPPLADRVFEVDERVLADGTVRTPLSEDQLGKAAREARDAGFASAAVLFLHSYAHPEHELRAGEVLRSAGFPHVTLSHEAACEIKAVPRGETACADAFLTPVRANYYSHSLSV